MQIVYSGEPFPNEATATVFFAGPTPRDANTKSWRPEALAYLESIGFEGHVFVPEFREGSRTLAVSEYDGQVEWEEEGLNRADLIAFWVPRDLKDMPAFTTNVEWGRWYTSGKVVYGAPVDAPKNKYLEYYAEKFKNNVHRTIESWGDEIVERLGSGAARYDGQATVPLYIWNKPEFQEWLQAQEKVGNKLVSAKVLFTFPWKIHFIWTLHVKVWIKEENRIKENEIIIGRRDIACVLMYHKQEFRTLLSTEIVLTKEFRSPVKNSSCFVFELPGGSSKNPEEFAQVAAHEIEEEAGISIDHTLLEHVATRQMCSTLLTHSAHLYRYQLNEEELQELKNQKGHHGVESDSERTYVQVVTLGQIIEDGLVDWSMIGMIMQGLVGIV